MASSTYDPTDFDFAPISKKLNIVSEKKIYQPSVNPYKNMVECSAEEYGEEFQSEVMKVYFSDDNVGRIQKKIKQEVYNRTKGKYRLKEDQDTLHLNVAMRTVFKHNGRNLLNHIIRQVKLLNKQTIEYIVPDMIVNIEQYYGLQKEISNPINPIDLPINVSVRGRKILKSTAFNWNN